MSDQCKMALLQSRRDHIREWLETEAPYAAFDQKHLDADTPEPAYWPHGYQAALTDIINLLRIADKSGNPGTPANTPSRSNQAVSPSLTVSHSSTMTIIA